MKNVLAILLLLAVAASLSLADVTIYSRDFSTAEFTTDLIAVPTSTTDVATSGTIWVTGLTLVGGSADVTVTATCKTSGVAFLNAVTVPAHTTMIAVQSSGIMCRGGVQIAANGSGASYQMSFRK